MSSIDGRSGALLVDEDVDTVGAGAGPEALPAARLDGTQQRGRAAGCQNCSRVGVRTMPLCGANGVQLRIRALAASRAFSWAVRSAGCVSANNGHWA